MGRYKSRGEGKGRRIKGREENSDGERERDGGGRFTYPFGQRLKVLSHNIFSHI